MSRSARLLCALRLRVSALEHIRHICQATTVPIFPDADAEWSEALRSTVKRALAEPPQVRQPIICNTQGKACTVDGFNTIFYRRMSELVKDKRSGLTERFQFRDLRAKSASYDTVEDESKRLGHADPKITERVYRRKAERAKPLR